MSITFAQLIEHARDFDAEASSHHSFDVYEDLCGDALRDVWNARAWPFHLQETTLSFVAPYSVGSLSVTSGNTRIRVSSSATWSTSWPTGRILIQGNDWDFLVTNFRQSASRWVATLDASYVGSTTSGLTYELTFPVYQLPSDFRAMVAPNANQWYSDLNPMTYSDWVHHRYNESWAGNISRYAVVPSSGNNPSKIYFYPAPVDARICRLPYKSRAPIGRIYNTGAADLTSGSTAMTGSATKWNKTGYSLVGMVVEISGSKGLENIVSSVNSATGITLSATWGGSTVTSANYKISTRINLPDYMYSPLMASVHLKVAQYRRDYQGMLYWENERNTLIRRALGSAWPLEQEITRDMPDEEYMEKPSIPRMIVT